MYLMETIFIWVIFKNANDDAGKNPESDIPKPDDQQKLRLHKVNNVMMILMCFTKCTIYLSFFISFQDNKLKQTPKLAVVSYLPVVQGKGTLASKIYQGL